MASRLRVLCITDLFPLPERPALGIFVERQMQAIQVEADVTVVALTRVFPHARLWTRPWQLRAVWRRVRAWRQELAALPRQAQVGALPVWYARYTSPPRRGFMGLWGWFAYPFVRQLLRQLWRSQRFDLIHAHYATPSGVVALLASRWMNIPVIVTVHGMDVTYTIHQHALSAAIIRWVFRRAFRVLANSTSTQRLIIEAGADPSQVEIVRLGGDLAAGPPASAPSAGGPLQICRSATWRRARVTPMCCGRWPSSAPPASVFTTP